MILLLGLLTAAVTHGALGVEPNRRHEFSPRMDYDEWTPLGRGDPLKNDPTYDYMPPVLDRVHYWVDPKKRTPDPPMLLSSVAMTETVTPATASSRLGTLNLLDPFLKMVDKTKDVLGLNANFYRPTTLPYFTETYPVPTHTIPPIPHNNHVDNGAGDLMPPPPIPVKSRNRQRPPFTMLMPPPPPALELQSTSPATSFATSTKPTTAAVLFEEETTLAQEASTTAPIPTQNTPTASTMIANSENLYRPVAITMPESISNETDDTFTTSMTSANTDSTLSVPIFTLFNENNNHLQDEERKRLRDAMVPAPTDHSFFLPTTVRTTTTFQPLTTDPMFKHYKQPSKPARGPFYLIIQGHSKVKTYGASKNKLTPLSMNDIDDERLSNYQDYDSLKGRRAKKMTHDDIQEEVIEGHPYVELAAKFSAKKGGTFSVSDGRAKLSKRSKRASTRFIRRRLLATKEQEEESEPDEFGLESLIALNDEYNSEDLLSLLVKQEGQGSGFGGFVGSLFSRSFNSTDEI